jgi:micrococcal nuclease
MNVVVIILFVIILLAIVPYTRKRLIRKLFELKQKINLRFSKKFVIFTVVIFIMIVGVISGPTSPTAQQKTAVKVENKIAIMTPTSTPVVVKKNETLFVLTKTVVTTTVNPKPTSSDQYTYYSVTSVTDGDTLKVNINGKVETLRLIGIDTPETVDPRKPVQCFGKEASNKAKELLNGRKVRIETDPTQGERDKYDRFLAYIYRDDGLFYNKYMIEQGYAHEYTYNLPYKYQAEFKVAQRSAQNSELGLWSPTTCSGNTMLSNQSNSVSGDQTLVGKYYTSSYSTSKYYYPESCDGWKSLNQSYLKSFNSLEELLLVYPSRTQSPQCD